MSPPVNRRVIVAIHDALLLPALRGRRDVAYTSDWPEDAEIIGATWDQGRHQLLLTVASAEFDEVLTGNVVPQWAPTITAWAVEPSARSIMDLIDKMHEEELSDAAART